MPCIGPLKEKPQLKCGGEKKNKKVCFQTEMRERGGEKLFSLVSVYWGCVSVETLANKSPPVLMANLSWCSLEVEFQAGGSSREKRLRQ